jgi:ubiquinone/menaquinone biosynthesis C-methylase UbiE
MNNEIYKINESKWDRRSQSYDNKRFDYFRFIQKKAISQMDLTENLNILDLGCGTGESVIYIANLLGQKGNFYGIDLSSGMIDKAITNSIGFENVHIIKANA